MSQLVGPEKKMERAHTVAQQLQTMLQRPTDNRPARLPSERQLAERFHCSRNTVREALATLAAQGLVDIRQRVGIYPMPSQDSPGDMADLEQALCALMITVPPLSRLAAPVCAASGVDQLETVTSNLSQALLLRDAAAAYRWCIAFFIELAQAANNVYLARMFIGIRDASQLAPSGRITCREQMETFFSGLVELLQALRRGDSQQAESIAQQCVAAFGTVMRTTDAARIRSEQRCGS